jgi:hypothetical protein
MSFLKLCGSCQPKLKIRGGNVFHRNQFSNVGLLVFCASLLLGTGPIIAGALVGAYFLFAIKIVDQWRG